jgi:hypothetical protein
VEKDSVQEQSLGATPLPSLLPTGKKGQRRVQAQRLALRPKKKEVQEAAGEVLSNLNRGPINRPAWKAR